MTGVTQTIGRQPSQTKTYHLAYTYYDSDDLKTLTVMSNGQTVKTLTYDWGKKEKAVREGTSRIAALVTNTSESLGTLGQIRYGNNTLTTQYKYNQLLQPISINCGSLMTNTYTYDLQGNVRTWNGRSYSYDGLDRLISEDNGSRITTYAYDKLGNRIRETNDGITKTYTYDTYKNRLLSAGNVNYSYDANHNRIRKSEGSLTWQYEYDPENRLTRVLEDGQEIGKYYYNPAGLRVKKIEDGKTTVYVYHDSQPVYEETFDTADQANLGVPARQELSIYLGNMKLAAFINGVLYYHLLDHLGSTKVIANASGIPVENLNYEAFGSPKEPAIYTQDDGSFERCSLQRLYGDPNKTNGQNYLYVGAKWRAAMHYSPADEYCETAASPTAADGAKVGRIYDNGSGQWKAFVLSNILLTPNKWYRISVKARAVTNLGTKYAKAYLSYNAGEDGQQVTKEVTWSASELASGEWVRKYVIFQAPNTPDGAPNWKVSAYLYGHHGEGIIEFDDYRIEEFVTQPSGPPPETPGYEYTGKKRDSATGLYYFGARYYDPEVGRFVTEDPAKDGMNWFVYCRNNPLKYVDPTGLLTVCVEGFGDAAFGLSGGISGGVAIDFLGGFGIIGKLAVGGGTPYAGIGVVITITDAEGIRDLAGLGAEGGISVTPTAAGPGIGVDFITGKGYKGVSVNIGLKGTPFTEGHGRVTGTGVVPLKINADKIKEFIADKLKEAFDKMPEDVQRQIETHLGVSIDVIMEGVTGNSEDNKLMK